MSSKTLTLVEKYAIKAMATEGLNSKEIATRTGRTEITIKKFIEEEIASELPEDNIGVKLRGKLLKELIKNGVEEKKARESIQILNGKLKSQVSEDQFPALYDACLKQQSARELFVTKSDGGNKGVTVMTEAASQVGERRTKNTRSSRDCIFNPQSPNEV